MKLRNKQTGEIIELLAKPSFVKRNDDYLQSELNTFNSLAELNAEWEDYEEPKEYWFITGDGFIFERSKETYPDDEVIRKEIGNYFETKEEAEEVVKKLKAIKILKDNGFRFIQWEFDMKTIADGKIWFDVGVNTQWDAEQLLKHRPEVKESLDLLFGSEE